MPDRVLRQPPYPTVLKPYGQSLVALAKARADIVCLTGDLTRQCEVDLFAEALLERFIHAGMAEANMMGIAGALARDGFIPFVHTFGVFATRRPLDQIINAIAFPRLPVRIMGFMPGVSSPGGPSHQAIVYVRLKRGEIPVIFGDDHQLRLDRAQALTRGEDVALFASGMMLAPALAAAKLLESNGVSVSVVTVPVVKPLDVATVLNVATSSRVVVSAENHTVVGGLGSAIAEALAEAGLGRPLRRIGLRDTFAEGSRTGPYLFDKYGLSTQAVVDAAWTALARRGRVPAAEIAAAEAGQYSPV